MSWNSTVLEKECLLSSRMKLKTKLFSIPKVQIVLLNKDWHQILIEIRKIRHGSCYQNMPQWGCVHYY